MECFQNSGKRCWLICGWFKLSECQLVLFNNEVSPRQSGRMTKIRKIVAKRLFEVRKSWWDAFRCQRQLRSVTPHGSVGIVPTRYICSRREHTTCVSLSSPTASTFSQSVRLSIQRLCLVSLASLQPQGRSQMSAWAECPQ